MRRMCVRNALRYGRENAISSKELARILGFRSVRDLQKAVERERAAGAVILSDTTGGGYFLSNDPEELQRFTRTLYTRARSTMKAAESAQRALDRATGQMYLPNWYGDEDGHQKEEAAPGAGTSESGNANNDMGSINDGAIVAQKEDQFNDEH